MISILVEFTNVFLSSRHFNQVGFHLGGTAVHDRDSRSVSVVKGEGYLLNTGKKRVKRGFTSLLKFSSSPGSSLGFTVYNDRDESLSVALEMDPPCLRVKLGNSTTLEQVHLLRQPLLDARHWLLIEACICF